MKKLLALVAAAAVAGVVMVNAEEKKSEEKDLKGDIGCTHCTYELGGKCGVSFKTADGKVYTLEHPSKELMEARTKGGTLKVTGKVTEKEGRLYVDASKAELEK